VTFFYAENQFANQLLFLLVKNNKMSGHPTVPVNGINTGTSTTSIPTGTTIIGGNLGGSGQVMSKFLLFVLIYI
jgi:hypothetical protein